ncbi:DUF6468 domain-containing protein [Rhizosaccharibacter radicis]|uniref:DUF6468 domain-containing protein n=1 Tax=Rhizosaccharibacter radicis TaxID=2782605 RepID=A0ABT1VZ96_9PROT|nr:DUF6468 domain-containing protein [Acetobacteraceae bacterium KSS12]
MDTSMTGLDWGFQAVLVLLLLLTMVHAIRLERALGVLRRDRAALEELVAGFNESTRQAEDGIDRLRAAADGAGRQLGRQIDLARSLKNDLVFLGERGEKIADQLDKTVRRSKIAEPGRSQPERRAMREEDEPAAPSRGGPATTTSGSDEVPPPRSQAERDLMRALRLAR